MLLILRWCVETLILGYDWESLKKGEVVVDVGGGIGSTTIHLARAYPDLRYVIQDRPSVVPEGIKVCFTTPLRRIRS
jgi:hypothetical protein